MMTQTVAALAWFAELVLVHHPTSLRTKGEEDRGEQVTFRLAGVEPSCPCIARLVRDAGCVRVDRFPASLDRPFVTAIAWLGLVPPCAAFWLFRRSHVDLGRNWQISPEVREQHAPVKSGVYRLIRHLFFIFPPGSCANAAIIELACGRIRTRWGRRANSKIPWPHLYEYPASKTIVIIERDYHCEPALFPVSIKDPARQPLCAIGSLGQRANRQDCIS